MTFPFVTPANIDLFLCRPSFALDFPISIIKSSRGKKDSYICIVDFVILHLRHSLSQNLESIVYPKSNWSHMYMPYKRQQSQQCRQEWQSDVIVEPTMESNVNILAPNGCQKGISGCAEINNLQSAARSPQ